MATCNCNNRLVELGSGYLKRVKLSKVFGHEVEVFLLLAVEQ
jgi:hypothetical protein